MPAIVKPNAIQRARLEQSQAAWQPPGKTIQIHGRTIPGGMLYVGSNVTGLWNGRPVEPALIDPKYKQRHQASYGYGYTQYRYWQLLSYHKLTAADRAAYLDWLASGRTEAPAYEQALLFIYGIERRILFDARYDQQAVDEIPALLDEVDRVVQRYGDYGNSPVRIAASNLRAAGEARLPGFDSTAFEPPRRNDTWSMPLALELALGTFALEHRPLPPKWAYSWAVCTPYTYLNTVERRCPNEFADYFAQHYHRMFGDGIVLPDHSLGGPLTYRPLSPSFQRPLQIGVSKLPSIGSPTYGYSGLIDLVREISNELEPFARAVSPGSTVSPLSAYGLLPEGMGALTSNPRVGPLSTALDRALIQASFALVEKASLLSFFPEAEAGPTPTQAAGISRLFERLGYGIEPDPSSMRTPFLRAERVGIYKIEFGVENYYEARDLSQPLAMLSMWSYVAATDGPPSPQSGASACDLLIAQYDLQPFEINRLHAHAAWLTRHPATLNDVRRRFGLVSGTNTDALAHLIVAMSSIDATMTPARIKALAKIYGVLGATSEQLHADIHRRSTRSPAPSQVIDGDRVSGFGIPAPPDPHQVDLDTVRLAAVRAQTDSIAVLLHDVFAGDDAMEPAEPSRVETVVDDDPYDRLLHLLAEQPIWSLEDVSRLAASLGLMASGTIETLNDRAVALGLEPLLDCDGEVCDCYEPTLKELLAHV